MEKQHAQGGVTTARSPVEMQVRLLCLQVLPSMLYLPHADDTNQSEKPPKGKKHAAIQCHIMAGLLLYGRLE